MPRVGTERPALVETSAGLREMADRARRFAGKLSYRDEGRLKLIAFAIELECVRSSWNTNSSPQAGQRQLPISRVGALRFTLEPEAEASDPRRQRNSTRTQGRLVIDQFTRVFSPARNPFSTYTPVSQPEPPEVQ